MLAIIGMPYGYAGWGTALADMELQSTMLREVQTSLSNAASYFGIQDSWFIVPLPLDVVLGVDRQQVDFEMGLISYAAGVRASHGWWWFYLYSMLVKLPLGTLAIVIVALVLGCVRFTKAAYGLLASQSVNSKESTAVLNSLMLPAGLALTVLLVTAAQSGFAQQHRYVLPAYPPMFLVTAVLVSRGGGVARSIGWIGLAASLLCTGYNAPNWLATFNLAAGGNSSGYKRLFNDASDWGQDTYRVRDWCNEHTGDAVYVHSSFSGRDELRAVGARFQPLPFDPDELTSPCLIVVSKSDLVITEWLSQMLDGLEPVDAIGGTHVVYAKHSSDDLQ